MQLGPAANFLIRVNFLPRVFLLRKVVSEIFYKQHIYTCKAQLPCTQPNPSIQKQSCLCKSSYKLSSASLPFRAAGGDVACSYMDLKVFCFASGAGWVPKWSLNCSFAPGSNSFHCTILFAWDCGSTLPEAFSCCTLFQKPSAKFLVHCTQFLLKLLWLELNPFYLIRSNQ